MDGEAVIGQAVMYFNSKWPSSGNKERERGVKKRKAKNIFLPADDPLGLKHTAIVGTSIVFIIKNICVDCITFN